MRLLPDGDYLCSLPEVFTRILTLAITDGDEICDYRIVTGGMRLAIWDLIEPSQKTELKRLVLLAQNLLWLSQYLFQLICPICYHLSVILHTSSIINAQIKGYSIKLGCSKLGKKSSSNRVD